MDDRKTTEPVAPSIELGGRVWVLKVTHRVLERFSAITKAPLEQFDVMVQRYDMMVLLLWLMMCETRADLTREGLTGWLNGIPVFDAMKLVSDAVAKAVKYSFQTPTEQPPEDADEAEPENPTGADS
jgi:hypothetical protein